MNRNKIVIFFLIILVIFVFLTFIYFKPSKKDINKSDITNQETEETIYSSNIIKDVYYSSKDSKGNEYIIRAKQGEIDYSNSNYIYLTEVKAFIKLQDSNVVEINSDYGKYNVENYDTIFSKNVIINYLQNKITGEYLDFSLEKNRMIISRKVVYTNFDNILKADVVEIDLETKNTKIFMYEQNRKVNIKNKN